jgi:hypothetical protein
LPSFN